MKKLLAASLLLFGLSCFAAPVPTYDSINCNENKEMPAEYTDADRYYSFLATMKCNVDAATEKKKFKDASESLRFMQEEWDHFDAGSYWAKTPYHSDEEAFLHIMALDIATRLLYHWTDDKSAYNYSFIHYPKFGKFPQDMVEDVFYSAPNSEGIQDTLFYSSAFSFVLKAVKPPRNEDSCYLMQRVMVLFMDKCVNPKDYGRIGLLGLNYLHKFAQYDDYPEDAMKDWIRRDLGKKCEELYFGSMNKAACWEVYAKLTEGIKYLH